MILCGLKSSADVPKEKFDIFLQIKNTEHGSVRIVFPNDLVFSEKNIFLMDQHRRIFGLIYKIKICCH